MSPPASQKSALIRMLNDRLRTTFMGGRVMMSAAVNALPDDAKAKVLSAVREFNDFNADNDPYDEHDCASFEVEGDRFIWKIDYYDRAMEFASPDPTDPTKTVRVLTIMAAEDY